METGIDFLILVPIFDADRTVLPARVSGRDTGAGGGRKVSYNVNRTRNAFYTILPFHVGAVCFYCRTL